MPFCWFCHEAARIVKRTDGSASFVLEFAYYVMDITYIALWWFYHICVSRSKFKEITFHTFPHVCYFDWAMLFHPAANVISICKICYFKSIVSYFAVNDFFEHCLDQNYHVFVQRGHVSILQCSYSRFQNLLNIAQVYKINNMRYNYYNSYYIHALIKQNEWEHTILHLRSIFQTPNVRRLFHTHTHAHISHGHPHTYAQSHCNIYE